MNKPEVILVFGLRKVEGTWKVEWKASHWLEFEEEGVLPSGVDIAIAEDMMKNKIGDKTFEITMESVRRAPELIGRILASRRARANGR